MRRAGVVLATLALAGCSGERDSGPDSMGTLAVGTPRVASNDVAMRANVRGPRRDGDGAVVGVPSLAELGSLPPPVQLGTQRAGCTGTTLEPTRSNLRAVRRATLCLLNAERRARTLGALRANARLARAAFRHARDMVVNDYFSHTSASGATFVDRIERSGYMRGSRAWTVGENLAWGSGQLATPSEIVRAWMDSPGHRANILNARFREVGIGLALGVPLRGESVGATYTTGFGTRAS